MTLKMMKKKMLTSAFVALSAVAMACGGDDGDEKTGGDGGGDKKETYDIDLTLISVLGQSEADAIVQSHKVELINAETGKPFDPPVETMTQEGSGKFSFKAVPRSPASWIHVIGNGKDPMSTYDSLSYSAPDSGEKFLRISTVGTAGVAEGTGGFKADPTKIAIGGAVYSVDDTGKRVGAIGCAEVMIDDKPSPAEDVDQRYVASTGLPTTLDKLKQTLGGQGKFYFGNVTPGMHTFSVKVGGKVLDQKLSLNVPFARNGATGPFQNVLVLIGIDIPGPNPTPAGCPTE